MNHNYKSKLKMRFILLKVFIAICILAVQAKPSTKLLGIVSVKDAPLNKLSPQVVGGTAVVDGDIPYQVGYTVSDGWFCGGSLIRDQWVLTSAVCIDGEFSADVYLGTVEFALGTIIKSSKIIPNPDFNMGTLLNDIALIKLASRAVLGPNIGTANLVSVNNPFDGEKATASGWGKPDNVASGVLNRVDLEIITNNECREHYGSIIQAGHLCCSGDNVRSTCNADSGGPLVLASTGELVGIASFTSTAGCPSPNPVGFTRVGHFLSWINDYI